MYLNQHKYPVWETPNLIFHLAELQDTISGIERGILVAFNLLEPYSELRSIEVGDKVFRFLIFNPALQHAQSAQTSPTIPTLSSFWKDRLISFPTDSTSRFPGIVVPIHLYAEVKGQPQDLGLQAGGVAIDQDDTVKIRSLVRELLEIGYREACIFIQHLRKAQHQYWLTLPRNIGTWWSVNYYSRHEDAWYTIPARETYIASEKFAMNLLKIADWKETADRLPSIMFKLIDKADLTDLAEFKDEIPYSFAEEIFADALVDLALNRRRSAIVHAVIALEAIAKHGLRLLLTRHIAELDKNSVLDAISKEVHTHTLVQIVHSQLIPQTNTKPIQWETIRELCNARNTIIHQRRKKLPTYEALVSQFEEVRRIIDDIERSLEASD